MRVVFLALFGSLLVQQSLAAMTEQELMETLKSLRAACQPKTKATDEQIDGMHKGQWNQGKSAKCYMSCILDMYKLMTKDNTLDLNAAITILNTRAPESIRATALQSVNNCKDAVKTPKHKCVAAFEIARCIYFDNPATYFLP